MKIKKMTGKISALLLTLILMISMLPLSILAAPTWDANWLSGAVTVGDLTILKTDDDEEPLAGAEYTLYKVADIAVNQTTGEIEYTALTDVPVDSTTTAADFTAAILVPLTGIMGVTTGSGTLTGADGETIFEDLPFGVYVAVETVRPDGVTVSHNFLISMPMTADSGITWTNVFTATPKNTVFDGEVEKTVGGSTIVTETGTGRKTVSIGDTVTYTLAATMPTDFFGEGTDFEKVYTTYKITDTAGTGLEIDTTSINVYYGDAASGTLLVAGTGYEIVSSSTGGFEIELIKTAGTVDDPTYAPYYAALEAGDVLTITYDALVTSAAPIGQGIQNEVTVNYDYLGSTAPGEYEPPTTPELYTYSHAIIKVNDKDVLLNTAEFVVMNPDGEYLTWDDTEEVWGTTTTEADAYVFVSGMAGPLAGGNYDGYIELIGLSAGEYTLKETKTVSGYSLMGDTVAIEINRDSTTTQVNSLHTIADTDYTTKIINAAGFALPGTGGMGIYIFTIGGVLLIAAGIILFTRNKKRNHG